MTSQEKILLTNMKRTVKLFQNITGDASEVEMWDDNSCLTALKELHMKEGLPLAFAFKTEVVGMIRSDLCRLVMLYNSGGYYFDTDLAPLAALQRALDPRATFVTVRTSERSLSGGGFFQAFLATAPKHPVIRRSLKNLVLINLHLIFFEDVWGLFLNLVTGKIEAISNQAVNLMCLVWFVFCLKWAGTGPVSHFVRDCMILHMHARLVRNFKIWYDKYWIPGQDQNDFRMKTARGG